MLRRIAASVVILVGLLSNSSQQVEAYWNQQTATQTITISIGAWLQQEWVPNPDVDYEEGDIVVYEGITYIRTDERLDKNKPPDHPHWGWILWTAV